MVYCGRVDGNPHFTGPHGLRYDFNGRPGACYCLLTDSNMQLNVLMDGFYDKRTEAAFALEEGEMARCWNREAGVIWIADGKEHTLRLVARTGPEVDRGDGFMAVIEVDGSPISPLKIGEEHIGPGGLHIEFKGTTTEGNKEVDEFLVQIDSILVLKISLHVANQQLRRPDESWNHINIGILDAQVSHNLHGLIGQVFRGDHEDRVLKFAAKVAELKAPVVADGKSGKGLLDGETSDYMTDSLLSTVCKYSVYNIRVDDK